MGWGGVGWGQTPKRSVQDEPNIPTRHPPHSAAPTGTTEPPLSDGQFPGSDWPSKTSEAKDTVCDDLDTFLSILGSPPTGAQKTECAHHARICAYFWGAAPGGAPGGPPQIADTLCVLHQKGTQRETARSQILSVFCIQKGWEIKRISVLSPYWEPLWRGAAAALPERCRGSGANQRVLCDSFRNWRNPADK